MGPDRVPIQHQPGLPVSNLGHHPRKAALTERLRQSCTALWIIAAVQGLEVPATVEHVGDPHPVPERQACRIAVDLLALAHDRSCEAELAECLAVELTAKRLPDLVALRARFAPDPAVIPHVTVALGSLASYESLLDGIRPGEVA